MADQQKQQDFDKAKADLAKKPKPANVKRMSQQFSSFVYHVDEEDKKARVLGRDAASWTRITIFYIVYYTLLGFLVTFTIRGYAHVRLEDPGEKTSLIHTRLDQPGGHIIPMNQISDQVDSENQIRLSSSDADSSHNGIYKHAFKEYAKLVNEKNHAANAKECSVGDIKNAVNSEMPICKVNNANLITEENLNKWISDETPVFGLALNKLVGWTPVNHKLDSQLMEESDLTFVKNAVYAHCYETDASGMAVEDSNLVVRPLKNSVPNLGSEFFPYHAKDMNVQENKRADWNRPFMLYQITKKDANLDTWCTSEDSDCERDQPHYISCYWDAQNIDRPQRPEEWAANENVKAWSTDLEKLGVGVTKFSIMFSDFNFDNDGAIDKHNPYGYAEKITRDEE